MTLSHARVFTMSHWLLLFFICCFTCAEPVFGATFPKRENYKTTRLHLSVRGESKQNYPCGGVGDMCQCQGVQANCSRNLGNLAFIPPFGPTITVLSFRFNDLESINTTDFFHNVTNLTGLDLGMNFLTHVTPGAFSGFHRLKTLSLPFSNLNYDALRSILEVRSLGKLNLDSSGLVGPIPDNLFYERPLPVLTDLKMDLNKLKRLNATALKPLQKLNTLSVVGSELRSFHEDYLPSLQTLQLQWNYLPQFPSSCAANGSSLFPMLQTLNLNGNNIESLPDEICLPRLEWLELSSNRFLYMYPHSFSDILFPSLQYLAFANMIPGILLLRERTFSNRQLWFLDISDNNLQFASDRVHEDAIAGCPNLNALLLSGNSFTGIAEGKMRHIFNSFHTLESLKLSQVKLDQLQDIPLGLIQNVSELYLSNIELKVIPPGIFDSLYQLKWLRLDGNLITFVDDSIFSSKLQKQLRSLNLSDNNFGCTCSLLWFRQWFLSRPELFDAANPYSRYDCYNVPDKTIASFYVNEQQCLLHHDVYVFTVVCSAVLLLVFTVSTLLFRYRWHLRLLMYEVFRGNPRARWRRRRPEEFQYDLFVSYSGQDVRWVIDHLIPTLEQDMGLRLCIHQRDFLVGNNITDNIVESLAVSKRVLALFSREFVKSQWCHFELEMCLRHVIENDDVMVIAILQDVPTRYMSGAMMALLKTTTYIQWGDELEARDSFWRRMTLALNDILSS